MHFILNTINGEYLRNITENHVRDTERVDAAVAYVTKEELLFDWCLKYNIPLKFWGRYDEGVPVAPPILRKFLKQKSAHYSCKLIRKFHAKVIWWHGVGAYVGSANLTDSAWHGNVEAGTFFEEAEMESLGIDQQLRDFFKTIDENSSPLTSEICQALENRQKQLSRMKEADKANAKRAKDNPDVKPWRGLDFVGKKVASDRNRQKFLDEWNSTLTIIRNLADKVKNYRPDWVSDSTPDGAHVDQFLHAHYYNRVMDGGRSFFEEWHEQNASNPDAAELAALEWWQEQETPPSHEDRMLNDWAPYLRENLSEEALKDLTEEKLFEIFKRVHAIADHARRIPNKLVGLPSIRKYSMDEKSAALAERIFHETSLRGEKISDLLIYIFYGGVESEVPIRLWQGISDPNWKIDHIGRNALGELVGWALPDRYPPRNTRTSKALYSLGHEVTV